jgi:signal transduction histidine kinase
VPNPKTICLAELVQNLMPDLMFEADARQCRVIHDKQKECPVFGSEDVLRRALENVIRNAIRYSPPGEDVIVETSTESDNQFGRESFVFTTLDQAYQKKTCKPFSALSTASIQRVRARPAVSVSG